MMVVCPVCGRVRVERKDREESCLDSISLGRE